jgi:outer membrane protein TolC
MKYRGRILPFRAGFCLSVCLIFSTWIASAAEVAAPAAQGPALGGATPGKVLKVEDAVTIAVENHPRIRAARERVGAQQSVLGQQMSSYYPTVSLSNSYRTTTSSGTTTTSQEAFDLFSSRANFDMTLYNFGKREGAVQSARESLDAVGHSYKTTMEEVVLAVKQAYYNYLQAKAVVKVREETVKGRELIVRQAQGFFEVGTRPRIDVARAESNLYNAQADLIAAENAVKVAWVTLKNAMGAPDLPEQPLAEELTITKFPISLERAREIAFVGRPELKDFAAQKRAQDQKIAAARREHLPDIIFHADYGRQNTSRSGDTFPLQTQWTVQLNLNIPIFNGFNTTNKVQETLHTYYSIKAQEEDKRQQVALEVEQSYLRLIEAQERIKATQAAERAAKENLALANGRYQVGVGSIIEVTDAQTLHTDAQTNHIRSLYDYKIAEAQLIKAMGSP